ncbi:hypothetical protein SEA_POCAHONTAS_64 [Mycobacterium phage Pocahontas]|uniref:Uncharacterized protein n=1 Tax=Mycobacterium phage Veracruz TaxID=2530154 RepID=A0A481VSU6_9CAUD|nr:hypothetical protein KIP27_gp30 [Mycobacterium phage Veracruz]AIS73737.1 hypothetical protein PBI_QUINNKIRO_63 [Mycobacterium phage QuinnKiro]AOT24212.1 hypothetical protein SEA_TODACORO_64 [Mycobacterium phage Todacoro]AYR03442.1 hypothetical protein SEA_POPCICLE_64 [Mycobacterium phage Popcicle]AZV00627.1 hypothetical protein SEA_NORBERT_61 [Mycobacterium phage Norbert]QDP44928.1 hypothetical protein SEA_POCAHONTAS_64 [Mycobacterium phage Pocahontas]
MPKPTAKANRLHQQILSDLLANRQFVRTEKHKDPKTGKEKSVQVVTGTLANNVSEFNLERAAKAWLP